MSQWVANAVFSTCKRSSSYERYNAVCRSSWCILVCISCTASTTASTARPTGRMGGTCPRMIVVANGSGVQRHSASLVTYQ